MGMYQMNAQTVLIYANSGNTTSSSIQWLGNSKWLCFILRVVYSICIAVDIHYFSVICNNTVHSNQNTNTVNYRRYNHMNDWVKLIEYQSYCVMNSGPTVPLDIMSLDQITMQRYIHHKISVLCLQDKDGLYLTIYFSMLSNLT